MPATHRQTRVNDRTVQWSHQNDVSILIDGDVLNLTGVVNDTSYEFRSRLTVQFYFTQKAVGASTALLESSLQYPTGEKDPETQEPTYTPTEPPETDSKSGPWGDEEEPIVVPTFEPSASGGGTEELAKEETGYFTEVEIRNSDGTVSQPTSTTVEAAFYRLADYEDTDREPAEIRKLEREYRTAVNELCYMCGKYKQEHEGACRGCRWKKPV